MTESARERRLAGGYDVFISYRTKTEAKVARTLHRRLQAFCSSVYGKRRYRVFGDVESLAADPRLERQIKEALAGTRLLAVLASPGARESEWVRKEIDHYLSLDGNGPEHVALLLAGGRLPEIDGESWTEDPALDTDLVERLKLPGDAVRLLHDLRPLRTLDGGIADDKRLMEVVSSLAAQATGRDKDELYGEHLVAQRKRLTLALVGIALLVALSIGLADTNANLQKTVLDLRDANHQIAASVSETQAHLISASARFQRAATPARAIRLAGGAEHLHADLVTWGAALETVHGSADCWSPDVRGAPVFVAGDGAWTLVATEAGPLVLASRQGGVESLQGALRFERASGPQEVVLRSGESLSRWGVRDGRLSSLGPAEARSAAIVVEDHAEDEEGSLDFGGQGGSYLYTAYTHQVVSVVDESGAWKRVAARVPGDDYHLEVLDGGLLAVATDGLWVKQTSLLWWSLDTLRKGEEVPEEDLDFEASVPCDERIRVSSAGGVRRSSNGTFWWIDSLGQVRRHAPGKRASSVVSDPSFGGVRSYAPASDGGWLACSGADGLRVRCVSRGLTGRVALPPGVEFALNPAERGGGPPELVAVVNSEVGLVDLGSGAPWSPLFSVSKRRLPGAPQRYLVGVSAEGEASTLVAYDSSAILSLALRDPRPEHPKRVRVRRGGFSALAISPEGSWLAWVTVNSNQVDLLRRREGEFEEVSRAALPNDWPRVEGLTFDSGALLVLGKNRLALWDHEAKRLRWDRELRYAQITPLPQAESFAVDDGQGRLLVFRGEGEPSEAGLLSDPALSLAHHPSKTVLAAGQDGRLTLVDSERRLAICEVEVPGAVSHVGFSHDGGILWFVADGGLWVWDVSDEGLRELAFERAGGDMSEEEWHRHAGDDVPHQRIGPR